LYYSAGGPLFLCEIKAGCGKRLREHGILPHAKFHAALT
jgi:hypothetical protein